MTRNELTERLLACETQIKFVSIREALRLIPTGLPCDMEKLEMALHAPMLAVLDGQQDIVVLASLLELNIRHYKPFEDTQSILTEGITHLFLTKNTAPTSTTDDH